MTPRPRLILPLLCLCLAMPGLRAAQLSLSTLATLRQSSTASTAVAANAVDGNTATLATTQNLTNSWWEAELPVPYSLTRIELVNPSSGVAARFTGMIVCVQDIRDQTVYQTTVTATAAGATWAVNLPAGLKGRILRVGLENGQANGAGDRVVSLAEARLFGDPILTPSAGPAQLSYSVTQSSEFGGYPASNAVDSNTGNFTHTADIPNSYWQITYNQNIPIQRIEVVNRSSCCGERLAGLVLRVLDASNNTVATTTLHNPGNGGTVTFTPPPGTTGRSVKIGLEGGATNGGGNYYVSLAEVRVISTVVSQSTTLSGSYPASNALDGNAATFTHTDATTPNNWWLYDMGVTKNIDKVEVVNRADCCNARLTGLVLRIQNSNQVTVASTTLVDAGAGQTVTFDAPPGTSGRYIRIGLENGQTNGGGAYEVTVAEVRVIEESSSGGTPSLATGKPSCMVRLTDALAPASYANDGNFSTVARTTSHTVDAYWEVDLGQEYAVYQVTTTAASGLGFNLGKTTTRLYDADHESVFARNNASSSELFETLTDGPRRARYVRVGLENKVRTTSNGSVGWDIGMKEVEVFGRPLSEVGILAYGASVTNVSAGQSATLSWDVEDVRELSIQPGIGSVGANTATNGVGSLLVTPSVSTEYVLIATNGCGASFQAVTVTVNGQEPPPVISEFMADNRYTLEDGDGAASDWIEIHNPRNTPINLAGYGLTDNPAQPFKWTMPSVTLPAHGFLVVFASNRAAGPVDPAGNLHAPFKLSADSGSIVLTAPGGAVADQILGYPAQRVDLAHGRTLGGAVKFLDPSPRAFNHRPAYDGWLRGVVFSEPRGYKTAPFTLTLSTADAGAQILYSTTGVEPNLTYNAPLTVNSTRSVRATTARAGYKPPLVETRTYIYVDDVITAPTMNTTITQNPAYTTRLRDGLTELLTLSINIPVTPVAYTEQKGSVELIFPGSTNTVHANCGVMRFANAWSDYTKRSYRLKFRAAYGESRLKAPIYEGYECGWEPIDSFDELDVRSGSQDMVDRGFYMAPVFVDDSMNDMGSINPHGRFVNLYLNGAYYGKFHVRERLIDQFLADYLGGGQEDYVTVRGNDNVGDTFVIGTPDPEKRGSWETMRSQMSNYAQVRTRLDIDHLTDFLLLWWYGNSESEYRAAGPVSPGSGFKFYLSDPDGFLRATTADRTTNPGPGGMFGALVTQNDPDFKMRVADRIYRHFFHNGAMTPARMTARLNARMNQIYNAMVAECARWNYRTPANWTQAATDIQTTLFAPRTTQLLGYLRTRGLYPAIDAPEFTQHGGQVSPGYVPVLTAGTGTIYYTLDGSDPRLPGGAVSPAALVWSPGAVTVNDDTRFMVRLRNGTTWSALNDVTFLRIGRVPASAANTLVTELHYNPEGADGGEFVELLNISTNRVDFTNVRFISGITYTFPAAFSLDPGEFALVAEDPALFASWYQTPGRPWYQAGLTVLGPYSGKFSNAGETVALVASNNASIATFAYDSAGLWPSRADGGGSSLELRDPPGTPGTQPGRDAALSLASSWRSSIARHGTPGRIDTAVRDVVIHEVLSHTDLGVDWIELHNRGSAPADISGRHLTDTAAQPFRFTIPNGTVIPAGGYVGFDAAQLGFGFSELGSDILLLESSGTNVVRYLDTVDIPAMAREETAGVYTRSDAVLDFTELRAGTRNAANALPRVGPLVISEIHYQPVAGQAEFVEIVNISSSSVDLFDPANPANTWELDDAVTYRFPTGVSVPAGGVIIVCNTNAAAFRAQTGLSPAIPVYGPWTGGLGNSGDNLKLRRPGEPEPGGFVPYYRVDRVVYQNAAPWPVMPVNGGASIVRHTLQAYGNDPAHWVLSAAGGTPGALPVNHPPSANVSGNTTVPAGSTLTLSVFGGDLDAPWQTTAVQVLNPPSGATWLPASGVFTWTPSVSTSPMVHALQVVATDNGIPALSVTNTVNLTVTEPFALQATAGGGTGFTVPVLPGEDYRVWFTDSLNPANWVQLQFVEDAVGNTLTIEDVTAPAATRRYYRVEWLRE